MRKNINYSFQPNGKYFIFDVDTGKTIKKDIPSIRDARAIIAEMKRQA